MDCLNRYIPIMKLFRLLSSFVGFALPWCRPDCRGQGAGAVGQAPAGAGCSHEPEERCATSKTDQELANRLPAQALTEAMKQRTCHVARARRMSIKSHGMNMKMPTGLVWLAALWLAMACLSTSVHAQQYVWRTLAGAMPGGADGVGDQAQFYYPYGITSDTIGNLYVADDLNHTVRKVLPNGTVTTLVGKAGSAGGVNGLGSSVRFNRPSGVALDRSGNLYVCDRGNHCIRKITPAGEVTPSQVH
jgi:hypothetical protein